MCSTCREGRRDFTLRGLRRSLAARWLCQGMPVCRLESNRQQTRCSFPPRYLATKPVGLEIMRIEAAQNRSWQSKMTYGRFYMVGAHGNPSPGVHQYQRAVSWGSYCWQAAPDMKTRPAGIGNVHADWMGSLPSKLSAMPLKHLAVPGESTKRKDI